MKLANIFGFNLASAAAFDALVTSSPEELISDCAEAVTTWLLDWPAALVKNFLHQTWKWLCLMFDVDSYGIVPFYSAWWGLRHCCSSGARSVRLTNRWNCTLWRFFSYSSYFRSDENWDMLGANADKDPLVMAAWGSRILRAHELLSWKILDVQDLRLLC